VLIISGIVFAILGQLWIAGAMFLAATGYLFELHRQKDAAALQVSLKRTGLEALGLSTLYALVLIAGLWQR